MNMKRQPSRTTVRTVRCPACGADVGVRCVGVREKVREANHMERVELASKPRAKLARLFGR